MNYIKIYNDLINSRKLLNRKKYNGTYYERHHIIMKSLGGSDVKENIVLLTAKEHYIAHLLLYKIHKKRQTAYALWWFNSRHISSRQYEMIKSIYHEYASDNMKKLWSDPDMRAHLSKENSLKNKGRTHTNDVRKNMSDAHIGIKRTKEAIEKTRKKNLGKKRSVEFSKKISKLHKGRKHTDVARKNMSEGAINRNISEDSKKVISEKASKFFSQPRFGYIITTPDNIKYNFIGFNNVSEFIKKHNLSETLFKKFLNKGLIVSKLNKNLNCNNWKIESKRLNLHK